jgi:hypothetical protein
VSAIVKLLSLQLGGGNAVVNERGGKDLASLIKTPHKPLSQKRMHAQIERQ